MDATQKGDFVVKENVKVLETTWETRRKGELITEGNRKKVLVRIQGIDQNLTIEVHASLIETIRDS